MHNLNGHFSNMIDECLQIATNEVVSVLTKIKETVLSKDTLHASDYCKAVILMYIQLEGLSCDPLLKQLFSTAVEICHICYSHDSVRTPRAILRLHNITFLHAYLCTTLFEYPKPLTRRMFGRYFLLFTIESIKTFYVGVLGATDYWVRFEWQHRGSPHVHGLAWLPDAPDVTQLVSSADKIHDSLQEEISKYADNLVSTCNPAVFPDGSNIDAAPHPKTDPHICNKVYGDIQDFDEDLAGLVATCQRHT